MHWNIRVATAGDPTEPQIEAILAAGVSVVHRDDDTGHIELIFTVEADDFRVASATAVDEFESMDEVQKLITAGVLAEPTQMLVRSDMYRGGVSLLPTAKVAEKLGVSTARIRDLKANAVEFPLPVPGLGVDLYDPADVETYRRGRDRTPNALGRPHDGDEELLTAGLRLLRDEATMPTTMAQDVQIQRAIDASGGRSVRGKAKILLDMVNRFDTRLGPVEKRPELRVAIARAREMWAP
jgi:hypothetical protein